MANAHTPAVVGALGSRVLVKLGLDTLPGTVINNYGSGEQRRVVVRLDTDDDEGEPLIVTVPVSEILDERATETEPPGTWLPAKRYEAVVVGFLQRVIADAIASGIVNSADISTEDRIDDITITTPEARIAIEVKYFSKSTPGKALIDFLARRVADRPSLTFILVSNVDLPDKVRTELARLPVTPVTWRGPDDDEALAQAVTSKLGPPHQHDQGGA